MKIRRFKPSDAAEMARMHRSTIREINSSDYSKKQVAAWSGRSTAKRFRKSMKQRIRFVAIGKNKIIGFGDFTKDGEINGLYVHPKYIGKGVGKKLLRKMEKTALELGIAKFTVKSSLTAKDFYKSRGYKLLKKTVFRRKGLHLQVYNMEKAL